MSETQSSPPLSSVNAGVRSAIGQFIPRQIIGGRHLAWVALILFALALGVAQLFVPPKFLIFGIMLIAGVAFTFTRPFFGLFLYYFVLIIRPAEMWPALEKLGLERIVGGFLIFSFIVVSMALYRQVRVVTHNIYWAILAFFAVQVVSIVFSVEPTLTMDHCVDYVKNIVFITLMIHVVDSRSRFRGFMWFHIILMGYIAVSSLIAYLTGNVIITQGITRVKSLTSAAGDPNALAATMDLTLPFVFLMIKNEKNLLLRIFLVALVAVMMYDVIISGSRGGMMGLVAVFLYFWALSKSKVIYGVGFAAIMALTITIMPAQYKERYITVAKYADDGEVDASSQGRLSAWKAGREMFYDHPIIGVGAGAFGWAHGMIYSPKFRPTFLKAHSMYFQIIGELGALGVASFGALLFCIFYYNYRLREKLRRVGGDEAEWYIGISYAIGISMCTLFVTAIFGHSLYRLHWLLCGGVTVIMIRLWNETRDNPGVSLPQEP